MFSIHENSGRHSEFSSYFGRGFRQKASSGDDATHQVGNNAWTSASDTRDAEEERGYLRH
jgi:hypothetical protein